MTPKNVATIYLIVTKPADPMSVDNNYSEHILTIFPIDDPKPSPQPDDDT